MPDDNDDLGNDALEENSGWLAEQESNETTQWCHTHLPLHDDEQEQLEFFFLIFTSFEMLQELSGSRVVGTGDALVAFGGPSLGSRG